jgi:hypothetical protein
MRKIKIYRMRSLAVVGLVSAALVAPAQSLFAQAQPGGTAVVMPEDYQLRLLEDQIQILRNKLYMKQKMTDKEHAEWTKQYKDVAKRLESWNKFTDEYGLKD